MPRKNILALLAGGDRRSIGRADQVAWIVAKDRKLFPQLVAGLWSEDPLIRMRAADASEKITRENPAWLLPYKKELLGLLAEASEQEMRWHLAAMVPQSSAQSTRTPTRIRYVAGVPRRPQLDRQDIRTASHV